jgi:hypothetical protein
MAHTGYRKVVQKRSSPTTALPVDGATHWAVNPCNAKPTYGNVSPSAKRSTKCVVQQAMQLLAGNLKCSTS